MGKIRDALGACSLGRWPTPLEPAAGLGRALGVGAFWLKREDQSSARYGGNKVRGLEFLLAGAAPGTVVVTIGGLGSTHCLATAVHARALGCRAVLAQFPQPETETARAVARACEAAATLVVRARTKARFPAAVARAWIAAGRLEGGRRRWVPAGGAHPRAVVGHFLAGLELAGQTPEPPDAIVAPLGSTGTAAGLCLAMAWLRWPTRVVGVRVAPWPFASRARALRLATAARRLVARSDPSLSIPQSAIRNPQLLVVVDGLGTGYGHPTEAGEAARKLAAQHGLTLDPTYGAKALAAIPALAERGFRRVVFWHTFAAP